MKKGCSFAKLSPIPLCFIAITKTAAGGWKDPILPHPHAQPGGGGGVIFK
jgi:hypothetical protein